MSDRTKSAYDRWASTYDTDPNPQTTLEFAAVLEAVAAQPGDRILDAGCGTGRYAAAFAQAGAEVTGVDFSERMLAVARAKLPHIEFHLGDLGGHLPFPNAIFAKICCAQTLKHLADLRPALREFGRTLEPHGLLVFSVTHPDMSWDGYEMRVMPDFILSQEADIHHHGWAAYQDALEAARFEGVVRRDIRVSELIAPFLTPASFAAVVGRPQVLLCTARKAAGQAYGLAVE